MHQYWMCCSLALKGARIQVYEATIYLDWEEYDRFQVQVCTGLITCLFFKMERLPLTRATAVSPPSTGCDLLARLALSLKLLIDGRELQLEFFRDRRARL